jgi:hypothetical protein
MSEQTQRYLKYAGAAALFALIAWWLYKQGYWQKWFGSTPVGATPPGVGPMGDGTAPPVDPYVIAAQILTMAAQQQGLGPMLTVNQWCALWEQQSGSFTGAPMGFGVAGSITDQMTTALVQAIGGDPSMQIPAVQFVGLMAQQQQMGAAGLGLTRSSAGDPYKWVN